MSKSIEVYSWGGNSSKRRTGRWIPGLNFAKTILIITVVVVFWLLWISRNGECIENFVSGQSGVEAYIDNIATRRLEVLGNPIWQLLPESSISKEYISSLSQELPVPEWLLNNLSSGVCHISAQDVDHVKDVLIVTEMTRIGSFAEKLFGWSSLVKKEHAGGLDIKYLEDGGVYFAVRGRILLITPSRSTLIRALTLSDNEKIEPERFQEGMRMTGGADVFVRVLGAAWPMEIKPFSNFSLAIRFDKDSPRVLFQGDFSEEMKRLYGTLLPSKSEKKLAVPFDGIASVSLNLGKPLSEWYSAWCDLYGKVNPVDPWVNLGDMAVETMSSEQLLQYMFTTIFRNSGSRLRLGWFGVDPHEMLPVPLIAGTIDARTDPLLALYEIIPPPPSNNVEIDMHPRVDQEHLVANIPFIGGQNICPSMAVYGEGVLLSSSSQLINTMMQWESLSQAMEQDANIYAHLRPTKAIDAIMPALTELAYSGLLRGYDENALAAQGNAWKQAVQGLEEVALLGNIEKDGMHIEIKAVLDKNGQADETANTAETSEIKEET